MGTVKKLSAVLASLFGLAVTANGYQPVSKRGYLSLYAFSFGVFASELPRQLIAGQSALLAAVTPKLSPRVRWFSWLVSALSWLGLAGLDRIGHQANQPLTAALDASLGLDRRTESGDLWKRPEGAGTAKSPGFVRMASHLPSRWLRPRSPNRYVRRSWVSEPNDRCSSPRCACWRNEQHDPRRRSICDSRLRLASR